MHRSAVKQGEKRGSAVLGGECTAQWVRVPPSPQGVSPYAVRYVCAVFFNNFLFIIKNP